jgi:hypothetical protein
MGLGIQGAAVNTGFSSMSKNVNAEVGPLATNTLAGMSQNATDGVEELTVPIHMQKQVAEARAAAVGAAQTVANPLAGGVPMSMPAQSAPMGLAPVAAGLEAQPAAAAAPVAAAAAPAPVAGGFCTSCGSQLLPGAQFCASCGTPTGGAAQPAASAPDMV